MTESNGRPGTPRVPQALSNCVGRLAGSPQDLDAFPNVLECLNPVWEAGKLVRKEGRLAIVPNGSMWLVTLSVPSYSVQTSVEVESLADVFEGLEALLRNGQANWRPDYESRKKTGKVKGA